MESISSTRDLEKESTTKTPQKEKTKDPQRETETKCLEKDPETTDLQRKSKSTDLERVPGTPDPAEQWWETQMKQFHKMSVRRSYEYEEECDGLPGETSPQPQSFEILNNSPDEGGVLYNQSSGWGVGSSGVGVAGTKAGIAPGSPPHRATRQEMSAECERLRNMILQDVGTDDHQTKPMIIVLIGPPGVGKSSLVCSLAAAISGDRWRQYAYVGSHGADGEPVTVFTETFEKFAMNRIPAIEERFRDNLLPTIVDLAGVENENSELWKELLKIVFFGRLPSGEALFTAYRYGVDNGVEGLKRKYAEYEEELKVDRIIFLGSATDRVPVNLIHCVREAARPSGNDGNIRAIPLYGAMTKYDQVTTDQNQGTIPMETFLATEKLFIEKLGLLGARNRYVRLRNYCDDTDPDEARLTSVIPEIDLPLLQFMSQVCDPAVKVINTEHRLTGAEGPDPLRRRRVDPDQTEQTQNEQNAQQEQQREPGVAIRSNMFFWLALFVVVLGCALFALQTCPGVFLALLVMALIFAGITLKIRPEYGQLNWGL